MILEIGFKIHEITNLQPIGGQEIRTLTNSIQPVGTHKVARDSRDSHGKCRYQWRVFLSTEGGHQLWKLEGCLFIR